MAEIRRDTTGDRIRIVLAGELTITHLQKVKAELQNALTQASSVEVRLENIQAVDVAFLQLLCSAHRTAADEKKDFTIGGELEQFRALLKQAGFQRHIGCRENSRTPCLWLCDSREQ